MWEQIIIFVKFWTVKPFFILWNYGVFPYGFLHSVTFVRTKLTTKSFKTGVSSNVFFHVASVVHQFITVRTPVIFRTKSNGMIILQTKWKTKLSLNYSVYSNFCGNIFRYCMLSKNSAISEVGTSGCMITYSKSTLFTSLKVELLQDINGGFAFSRPP